MFTTMITMCRYDLSQEENNLANNLFEKFIKQQYDNIIVKESIGFWKEVGCEMVTEKGFTISNLNHEQIEDLKNIVANTDSIGLIGHSQQGFIEIDETDEKVNTYRLDNHQFVPCTGESDLDWGVGLTEKICIPVQNLEQLNNMPCGGTILDDNVIIYCCKEQAREIKQVINLKNKNQRDKEIEL